MHARVCNSYVNPDLEIVPKRDYNAWVTTEVTALKYV